MKTFLRLVLFLTACQIIPLAVIAAPAAKEHDETLFIFQNRKISIRVPAGFDYSAEKDDRGLFNVRIADARRQVALSLTFAPAQADRFKVTRDLREFMAENFGSYVESSVEKSMQFEDLSPNVGLGTYCVFTDASLVGKPPTPGEFLCMTAGVKAWPGVMVVFTNLSHDTTCKEYTAILTMLRSSVHEVSLLAPPPRP